VRRASILGAMGMLTSLLRRLPAAPAICQVCGSWPTEPVCRACVQRFAASVERCVRCARPVNDGQPVCGDCLTRVEPPTVLQCVAAVDYRFPWDGLIARLKFLDEPGWAEPLAHLMWRSASDRHLLEKDMVLVPVPATPARLAERGYNQAWELCRVVGRLAGLEARSDALMRIGDAPDQHRLPLAQRLSNLRGAFVVNPCATDQLRRRRVVVVDDVRTSGATLEHAGRALLQAGVDEVRALVLARTLHGSEEGK